MAELPTGTVTFLFTDVEGSTRLWEQNPAEMRLAVVRHDALVEDAVTHHGGVVVRPRGEGDSRFAVFARASDAVAAAVAIQVALRSEAWPTPVLLRVRVALHTGEADLREGDYYGSAVNRCARLRALAHGGQAVVSQTTHDLVRGALPERTNLRDLGEHRLKDLEHAERVFQILHPALPADFPPLRALDTLPNNLPRQLTSFIGRDRELAEVRRLLAASPLVTLTGTGGCGKTRLALQVAGDRLDGYPDGVWLVELAPLADATLVPNAVAAALGARGGPGQPIEATLVSFLRARRLLLLLDNCEHLLDACARLADVVLRSCPDVRILATSREALGIAGEVSWRVPSLALPRVDQGASLAALGDSEAIQLFVDRAGAVQPDFALAERNAPVVAQICRRLDGIPLAVELAATRVRALPLEQIAARLDQRFRLLTGGSRTALPRQQTLAALVGWSYDLLNDAERALFDRLSVFAGGFTLEAAEAVCGDTGDADRGSPSPVLRPLSPEEVLDLLSSLVGKSLVVTDGGAGGVERYHLLETLRQYGRERLVAAGDAEIIERRHAAYYLQLAEEAAPHLFRPEQLVYLARLDREWDNIRAALRWYLDRGEAEEGLRLVGALEFYLWYRGLDETEGYAWRTQLLNLPGPALPSRARANALLWTGLVHMGLGDLATMRRLFAQSLAMARQVGDDRLLAWVMHRIARYGGPDHEQWYGATDQGLAEGALALYRAAGDRWGIAVTLAVLGHLAFLRSDPEQARLLLAESLATARVVGEHHCVAFALRNLGEAISAESDAEAGAHLSESLRLYRELTDVQGVACVENLLGRLDCLHRRYASAREHCRAGLRWFKINGDWLNMIAQSMDGLAMVAAGQGQAERALRLAAASARQHELAAQPESPIEQAELDRALAPARQALGDQGCAAASGEGRAMTLEEAISYALEEDGG